MIIVLLLLFQSLCLYCQRLVLHVYDRWIHPKNVRLLKEAAELTGNAKLLQQSLLEQTKRSKKRNITSGSDCGGGGGLLSDSCRFCANTPKGFCRHHQYLQELEIKKQQQQQRQWNPLGERESEYRQWRKANRELKRNLKNRFLIQKQQIQTQQQLRRQTRLQNLSSEVIFTNDDVDGDDEIITSNSTEIYNNIDIITSNVDVGEDDVVGFGGVNSSIDTFSTNSTETYNIDSGYYSTITTPTLNSPTGTDTVETVYYFEPLMKSSSSSLSSKLNGNSSYAHSLSVPVSISTTYL